MPIPTSLIVVLLVAAWLAVLVPMVARRREAVPETEEGQHFRVLRRASASIRRRRPTRRTDLDEDDELTEHDDDVDAVDDDLDDSDLGEELLDDEDDDLEDDDEDGPQYEAPARRSDRVPVMAGAPAPEAPRGVRASFREEREPQPAVHADRWDGWADEYRHDDQSFGDQSLGDRGFDDRGEEAVEDERYRPVPHRPGRGGYDPDAAEATRHYRYRRRRRVASVLLLATVAFSAAAVFLAPMLWVGAGVFGLLLVSYLGYLRRQVRIEEDIRQRRLAKLRRARQIRPEYHPREAFVAAPGPVRASVPPATYGRGRTVVDLDDDDPSFDDLEYYRPVTYRRASGQ